MCYAWCCANPTARATQGQRPVRIRQMNLLSVGQRHRVRVWCAFVSTENGSTGWFGDIRLPRRQGGALGSQPWTRAQLQPPPGAAAASGALLNPSGRPRHSEMPGLSQTGHCDTCVSRTAQES